MSQNILVFAAHPDDEVLGCGGTIHKHAQAGDSVHVVILAEGITSRMTATAKEQELTALAASARSANNILGVASLDLHSFPDNRMDSLDRLEIIRVTEEYIRRYQPSTIYTHHHGDLNVDHRRIFEAVLTAARPQPGERIRTILSFEIPSSTEWQMQGSGMEFKPVWFSDISNSFAAKCEALRAYSSEMRSWPHARSLEAVTHLARWRGASVGCEAAEAFQLVRRIT